MDALTTVCVVLAIAIGTSQLVKEGLQEFLNRPAGVGASPSEEVAGGNLAATPAPPGVAQLVPPQPSPTPHPIQRRPYPSQPTGTAQRVHSSDFKRGSDHARQYR